MSSGLEVVEKHQRDKHLVLPDADDADEEPFMKTIKVSFHDGRCGHRFLDASITCDVNMHHFLRRVLCPKKACKETLGDLASLESHCMTEHGFALSEKHRTDFRLDSSSSTEMSFKKMASSFASSSTFDPTTSIPKLDKTVSDLKRKHVVTNQFKLELYYRIFTQAPQKSDFA